jgi:hypothetical protein
VRWAPGFLGLAALAIALGLPSPAHAQWKWRDKSGQINVSDRPPPRDVPEKDILSRPVPEAAARIIAMPSASASGAGLAASAAAAPATALEREVQARKRAAEQEQAAKARADEERLAERKAENCRAAKGHLTALESGQRIARVNDKGEREILDDKGRAEEQRRARDAIAANCS